ncbi:hypothetical protein ENUP19_0261G0012 [Entamoeba nuttalli]|uniref:Myb/SANT-like DNA-binding domain-containing protein n=2 Tax=Entamoeba nuttalli TaxID=412467 RepID=A0ABQ0DSF8_9EUKA
MMDMPIKQKRQPESCRKSAFQWVQLPSNCYIIDSADNEFYEKRDQSLFKKLYKGKNFELTADEMMSSRAWTERSTVYVLLKYFYWKYTEPSVMSLHEMYKTIAASVALDMGINKTSTQIRDKINNVKSGYKKDKKAIRSSPHSDTISLKYISSTLYDVMDKYFDESKVKEYDDVLKEVSKDIHRLLH